MDKKDFTFDTWFSNLSMLVLDRTGVEFKDADSVKADYDAGKNMYDVADEICAEYGED